MLRFGKMLVVRLEEDVERELPRERLLEVALFVDVCGVDPEPDEVVGEAR
jgi:hypothetical protein